MRRWLLGAIIVMATVVSGCGTLVIRTTPSYGYYPNYAPPLSHPELQRWHWHCYYNERGRRHCHRHYY